LKSFLSSDSGAPNHAVVESFYVEHLAPREGPAPLRRRLALQAVEASGLLESCLLPRFEPSASADAHVLSIVAIVCEKAREGVAPWAAFEPPRARREDGSSAPAEPAAERAALAAVAGLFARAQLLLQRPLARAAPTLPERCMLLAFLARGFQSLEVGAVRRAVLRLVGLPTWSAVAPARVELELARHAALRRPWARALADREALRAAVTPALEAALFGARGAGAGDGPFVPADAAAFAHLQKRLDGAFMPSLLAQFFEVLASVPGPAAGAEPLLADAAVATRVRFCERFLELAVDLLSQLPTRRFFRLLLEDSHFLLRCRHSGLARRAPGAASLYGGAAASSDAVMAPPSSASTGETALNLAASSAGVVGGVDVDAGESDALGAGVDAAFVAGPAHADAVAAAAPAAAAPAAAAFAPDEGARLFAQLLDMCAFFLDFEVDDQTGRAQTDRDVEAAHYARVAATQSLAHKFFAAGSREMREFALGATGVVSQPRTLRAFLSVLDDAQMLRLAANLRLLPQRAAYNASVASTAPAGADSAAQRAGTKRPRDAPSAPGSALGHSHFAAPGLVLEPQRVLPLPPPSRRFVLEVLLAAHARRRSQLRAINALPLYPSEALLWDANVLPAGTRLAGDESLALPKLNLQFLTLYDYLLRSFHLFRLESAYGVRADLVEALRRAAPRRAAAPAGAPGAGSAAAVAPRTVFTGWSRMAVALEPGGATVKAVFAPRVGAEVPAGVAAEVRFDTSRFAPHIRAEWDALREHDVVFLVSVHGAALDGGLPEDALRAPAVAAGARVPDEEDFSFPARYGVVAVRGCEVSQVLDEQGNAFGSALSDVSLAGEGGRGGGRSAPAGAKRALRVRLDPAQYFSDCRAAGAAAATLTSAAPLYAGFNLLVRRDARSNNFKAVLETVREVMNSSSQGGAVPAWLHDVLLGYGDPAAAHFRSLPAGVRVDAADFRDTFVSAAHVREAFPRAEVVFRDEDSGTALDEADARCRPPFCLQFEALAPAAEGGAEGPEERVVALPYILPLAGPFPEDVPRTSGVRFTAAQVEAVRSSLSPGLTLVVGPPGTGKTDTVVQAIACLYHNFPSQKILLVTHSNQALNDIFAKLLHGTDVAPRHLLRLGAGERDLDSDEDFSKAGRVGAVLARRLECLAEVERLGLCLGAPGDVGYTCETAGYFFEHHVRPRVDAFRRHFRLPAPPPPASLSAAATAADAEAAAAEGPGAYVRYERELAARAAEIDAAALNALASASPVAEAFPFTPFFTSAPRADAGGIFRAGAGALAHLRAAEACIRHLATLADELAGFRAFELLRTQRARTDFMLVKQARIVAMTCTHASIMRQRFVALDFKYDSLVMEEAAQALEVETLIPMLLQKPSAAARAGANAEGAEGVGAPSSRLKRVVLVGDHHQLPPVVQNASLARFAKLDQSMFARLVRLGAPAVHLRAQGRARPSLARLYSWRYGGLADLPLVRGEAGVGADESASALARTYRAANAGLALDHQVVDVADYQGVGESTPSPHYFQNLGEAEYVVAVYQYLRLVGVPAARIALLATYNGQKALLRDVVRRRCAPFAVFGEPARIDTVDTFQGQQSDIVLLSLVRTKSVGHLRDVRRLVVALSRARLGLYVFCRQALFASCLELQPAFALLAKRPAALQLVLGESHPTPRAADADAREHVARSGGALALVSVDGGITQMGEIVQRILSAQRGVGPIAAPASSGGGEVDRDDVRVTASEKTDS
jgi:intron-binding protein aquarius